MRSPSTFAATALAAAAMTGLASLPAGAACTRLAFSVNDYGKDGPTADAKTLLDKYVAKWAGEHNIAKYTTGTKEVKCEMFLNFIVFDEHTCRAEATVCWDGPPVAKPITAEGETAKPASTEGAPVKRAAASASTKVKQAAKDTKPAAAPIETGTLPSTTPDLTPTPPAAPEAAPAAATAAVTPAPAPAPEPVSSPAAKAPATAPGPAATPLALAPTTPTAPASQSAVADQALAAAKKAADAAERAAASAERAAAAAAAASKKAAPAAGQ